MEWLEVLGWGSPIGLGLWFAGFGVFLWGAHLFPGGKWSRRGGDSQDK